MLFPSCIPAPWYVALAKVLVFGCVPEPRQLPPDGKEPQARATTSGASRQGVLRHASWVHPQQDWAFMKLSAIPAAADVRHSPYVSGLQGTRRCRTGTAHGAGQCPSYHSLYLGGTGQLGAIIASRWHHEWEGTHSVVSKACIHHVPPFWAL